MLGNSTKYTVVLAVYLSGVKSYHTKHISNGTTTGTENGAEKQFGGFSPVRLDEEGRKGRYYRLERLELRRNR